MNIQKEKKKKLETTLLLEPFDMCLRDISQLNYT